MKLHFFTLVQNGLPFIKYHIDAFTRLPPALDWHWHIIEGLATHTHDTAWCAKNGGHLAPELHNNGLSNDGTTAYLDEIKKQNPARLTIYRKPPGAHWDGKREMVNAPLARITDPCLLWQIDADELWTPAQIQTAHDLFERHPEKTAAYFLCHYFFGPRIASSRPDVFGNFTQYEWLRLWRYRPGDTWTAHEPPLLTRNAANIAAIAPIKHDETKTHGLVFQHYAYATEQQVAFKEKYYGYAGAVAAWRKLQTPEAHGQLIRKYLLWVKTAELKTSKSRKLFLREHLCRYPGARALPYDPTNAPQLATPDATGEWQFAHT